MVLPTGRLGIDSLLQHVYLYSNANSAGADKAATLEHNHGQSGTKTVRAGPKAVHGVDNEPQK
jgi:hypothetical protein